jgi:serine/threonine protein kinase
MPDEAAALVTSLDANDAAYSAHKGNMVSLGDDKYHIHRKLSEGAFGVVYTGTKLLGEIPVVIKFVRSVRRLTASRKLTLKLGTKEMRNPSAKRRVSHLPSDH